jgi:hypothetical protein
MRTRVVKGPAISNDDFRQRSATPVARPALGLPSAIGQLKLLVFCRSLRPLGGISRRDDIMLGGARIELRHL